MDSPLTIHVLLFILMLIVYRFFPGGFENNFTGFTKGDVITKKPTLVDIVYYTSTVHSTTGSGDITPTSQLARFTTSLHMMLVFSFIILGITIGLGKLVKFIHKRS